MNTTIIIQARLGSSRLPSKVLLPINGKPSIIYQYERIKNCKAISNIVVAIPDNDQNNKLEQTLKSNKIKVYRGSENNVFERFLKCAEFFNADQIIRINGDCPLVSRTTIESLIDFFNKNPGYDYSSTTLDDSFPIGEHVEIFKLCSMKKASELRLKPTDCEHVTPIFYNNSSFKFISYKSNNLYPKKLRLCIDYPEDYKFILDLVSHFKKDSSFELKDIIAIVKKNPHLMDINSFYIKSRTIN